MRIYQVPVVRGERVKEKYLSSSFSRDMTGIPQRHISEMETGTTTWKEERKSLSGAMEDGLQGFPLN